jgi:hypothetical protein
MHAVHPRTCRDHRIVCANGAGAPGGAQALRDDGALAAASPSDDGALTLTVR